MTLRIETRQTNPDRPVRVLTLDRPEVRNALDTTLLVALVDAFADAADETDLAGLVLAGAGGCFSAGADLTELRSEPAVRRRSRELFATLYEQVVTFPAPVVAAVEGPAVGGGVELAAASDVRVLSRSARIAFPGARHGIPVGVARTIGLVGLGTARDWVLSSRTVDAEEAAAAGFAQQLVADGDALPSALAWLAQVAENDQATVRVLKQAFVEHGGVRDRTAWENDAMRAQVEVGSTPRRPARS